MSIRLRIFSLKDSKYRGCCKVLMGHRPILHLEQVVGWDYLDVSAMID